MLTVFNQLNFFVMRRVIYAAATAFAAFALMTACDKAETDNGGNDNVENPGDGGNTGGEGNVIGSIADIPGDYSGSLTVGEGGTPIENQVISITKGDSENTVDLTVSNFSIASMQLGNITIPDVPVSAADGKYSLTLSEAADVTLSSTAQAILASAKATMTGTVESTGAITLSLNITATMAAPASSEIPVTVTFTGSKAAAE